MRDIIELPIDSKLSLGIDMGIGSSGIGGVGPGEIRALYVRCFPVPETAKNKELLNANRRQNRLTRRQTHRRRRRRNDLAKLLAAHLPLTLEDIKGRDQCDPWEARARGLRERLSPIEFAAALMHIGKRRGFQSNSKKIFSGNDPEGGKALKGVAAMTEKSQRYNTVGEMLFKDEEFAKKKRNRPNDYSHTVSRDSMRGEVQALFANQRRLGANFATEALESTFMETAFYQRPLKASAEQVGECPFETDEKRAASFAPGFERFRYLSKINTLSIIEGKGQGRRLNRDEIRKATDLFGTEKSITYKHLRAAIGLTERELFMGVPTEKPSKRTLWEGADVCRSIGCCAGTYALRNVLSDIVGKIEWARLLNDTRFLDDIVFVITFREEIRFSGHGEDESIERGLREIGVSDELIEPLLTAVEKGIFKDFRGAGQISAKAARNINPHLEMGLAYYDAAKKARYEPEAQTDAKIENIANPVVQKILRENLRHFTAVVRKLGARPGRVTIEMAREVGKSVEVRDGIRRANDRREHEKTRLRELYAEDVGKEPTSDELLAYQLWKEQKHCCVYSGKTISASDLDLSRRAVEIDHILPRSRSQDNSYFNKILCTTEMNQAKKNRSAYEWMIDDPHPRAFSWEEYSAWVESLSALRGMKKRNLLMRNFADREERFVSRNLNDTRYAMRVFRAMLEQFYRDEPVNAETGRRTRRVFTRPGPIVAIVRKSWNLEGLKKDRKGNRRGDLHHAVDAAVVAALGTDEALTRDLTHIYQRLESKRLERNVPNVRPPWENFKDDLETALREVFVSRPEKRKGTGEGHEATIRRFKTEIDDNGFQQRIAYERKDISKVVLKDLEKLDQTRQADLIRVVSDWLDKDKKTRPPCPRMPLNRSARKDGGTEGPEIRKLRLPIAKNSGIEVRDGLAANGSMVRSDVFRNDTGFWLVPIYAHQVADKARYPMPPSRACIAYKPPEQWEDISGATFLFSLYPGSYARLENRKNEVIEGYFKGMDISVAAVNLALHSDSSQVTKLGVKTLLAFEKLHVDILGSRAIIKEEPRIWHGVACT